MPSRVAVLSQPPRFRIPHVPCADASGDFAVIEVWRYLCSLCLAWWPSLQSVEEAGPVQQGTATVPEKDWCPSQVRPTSVRRVAE
jgi:hypothetical protein